MQATATPARPSSPQARRSRRVAPLASLLPADLSYRVVFMDRNIEEIVASQNHMLQRLEREGASLSREQLRLMLHRQVDGVKHLLLAHRIPTLFISYSDAVARPRKTAERVAEHPVMVRWEHA